MTFLHKLAQRLARLKSIFGMALIVAVACEQPLKLTDPSGSGSLARIQVSPKSLTILTNQVTQFVAIGLTATGDTAPVAIRWSVTGGSIVDTNSNGGRHYGRYKSPSQAGRYSVTIQSVPAAVADSAVVMVSAVPVASVAMSPATASLSIGQLVQLTATAQDSTGAPLPGRVVTWTSSNDAVAHVTADGLVTGAAPAAATVTAASEGKSSAATITVTQVPVATVSVSPGSASLSVGQTAQLTAMLRDANGNPLSGRTLSWSSNNPAVATVSASGLATAIAAGSAVITAASEGKSGTASIGVGVPQATLVRIILAPDTATVNAGKTQQFSVSGKYSDSSSAPVSATFAATGGTITTNGLYTASQTAGTFSVIATSANLADTSTVAVVRPPVASVVVNPALDTVPVGQTLQLTATPRDAAGTALTGRVVTWASSNAAVATVSSSGLLTAVAPGFVVITATSEGVNGTSNILVAVVVAATVQVTPSSGVVSTGATRQLTATARDAGGNLLSGHAVAWTSLNPAIATVNASGLVTGVASGTATIQAVVDTASGTATVTVSTVSGTTPWIEEDFSTYTSAANMLADPRGIYSVAEDENPSRISLDQSTGYGASNRSMRYDYVNVGCTSQTVGRNMTLPYAVKELWAEFYVKFSIGFTSQNPLGCATPPDYKFIFGRLNEPVGRFAVRWGSQSPPSITVEAGPNVDLYTYEPIAPYSDGLWHRVRVHWKAGPSGTPTTVIQTWVDGKLIYDRSDFVMNGSSPAIYGLALGRNLDQGLPNVTMSLWWGLVRVWNASPGW